MADLRRILAGREALYARADVTVDTAGIGIEESLHRLAAAVSSRPHPAVGRSSSNCRTAPANCSQR